MLAGSPPLSSCAWPGAPRPPAGSGRPQGEEKNQRGRADGAGPHRSYRKKSRRRTERMEETQQSRRAVEPHPRPRTVFSCARAHLLFLSLFFVVSQPPPMRRLLAAILLVVPAPAWG